MGWRSKIQIEDPISFSKVGLNDSCIGKNLIRRPPKMSGKKIVDPSSIGVRTVSNDTYIKSNIYHYILLYILSTSYHTTSNLL